MTRKLEDRALAAIEELEGAKRRKPITVPRIARTIESAGGVVPASSLRRSLQSLASKGLVVQDEHDRTWRLVGRRVVQGAPLRPDGFRGYVYRGIGR